MPRDDNTPMETQQGKRILSGQPLQTDDLDSKALSQDVAWDISSFPSSLDQQPAYCPCGLGKRRFLKICIICADLWVYKKDPGIFLSSLFIK